MAMSAERVNVWLGAGKPHHVVRDVNLQLAQGKVLSIIAPSGAGKTTLLYFLAGILPIESKSNYLNFSFFGQDYNTFSKKERVGFAFQRQLFFEWSTIIESIVQYQKASGLAPDKRLIKQLLSGLGIAEAEDFRPSEMSGGMLARAALARAMSISPRLLLLDEPFYGLDELSRSRCLQVIRDYVSTSKCLAILVSHHLTDAAAISDKIMVLSSSPMTLLREVDLTPNEKSRSLQEATKIAEDVRALAVKLWLSNDSRR